MKIFKITFILLALSLLSCKENSTKNDEKEFIVKPEDVGKINFDLLKGINNKTIAEYNNQIITYQEFKNLGNNPEAKLNEYYRNDIKSVTPEMFEKITQKDFEDIKATGINLKIDWDKITFSDFKYEIFEFDGAKGLKGETYFKNSDGKLFSIKSQSFYNGKGYVTVKIGDIEEK